MASQDFDATRVPADIVAGLGLAVGKTYSCQNVSTINTLLIRESANAPDPSARAFKVESGGQFTIEPTANRPIWVWADDDAGCPVIITEAP